MLVPDRAMVERTPPFHALTICSPGAYTSTQLPVLEKAEILFEASLLPTVMIGPLSPPT